MNRFLTVLIMAGLSVSLAACSSVSKQTMGVGAGAAAGGLIGSRFGGGSGRIAATVAGAALGALAGGYIGSSMDKQDKLAAQQALEKTRTNHTTTWKNPDNGNQYTVKPTRTYKKSSGQYCREYQMESIIAGKKQQMYGTACRQPDGSWKQVSQHNA